jgi:hypothetical protein
VTQGRGPQSCGREYTVSKGAEMGCGCGGAAKSIETQTVEQIRERYASLSADASPEEQPWTNGIVPDTATVDESVTVSS